MNPDIQACRTTCLIAATCHRALSPETINIAGGTRKVTEQHRHVTGTMCRHYTCWSGGGEESARTAMKGAAEPFTVTEVSGRSRDIRGWAFGTSEKPTAKAKLRIVSEEGFVYSLQDNVYYATGQCVLKDRPGRRSPAPDSLFR